MALTFTRALGWRVMIWRATRPTLRAPGTGSVSDSTPSMQVPCMERSQASGESSRRHISRIASGVSLVATTHLPPSRWCGATKGRPTASR